MPAIGENRGASATPRGLARRDRLFDVGPDGHAAAIVADGEPHRHGVDDATQVRVLTFDVELEGTDSPLNDLHFERYAVDHAFEGKPLVSFDLLVVFRMTLLAVIAVVLA